MHEAACGSFPNNLNEERREGKERGKIKREDKNMGV